MLRGPGLNTAIQALNAYNSIGQPNNLLANAVKRNASPLINSALQEYGSNTGNRALTEQQQKGLNAAFTTFYRISSYVMLGIFLALLGIGFLDILLFAVREVKQYWEMFRDPNVFNKDTTDMAALSYVSAVNPADEPFHIYQSQRLISLTFILIGVIIIVVGLHIGMYFLIKIYSIFNESSFSESFSMPGKEMVVIGIVAVTAIMLNDMYKRRFVVKVQGGLRDIRDYLREIRYYIYDNMTTDAGFLVYLTTDDVDGMITSIMNKIKTKNTMYCQDPLSYCDGEVDKMLFTLNLYTYLKSVIPESDPNFQKVRDLFTLEGIESREIDPPLFMYYKQPVYIPNIYSSLRSRVSGAFLNPKGEFDMKREQLFISNLNRKMQDLNMKLSWMFNMPIAKKKVVTYLVTFFLFCVLISVGLFAVYYPDIKQYIPTVKAILLKIWRRIAFWRPRDEQDKKEEEAEAVAIEKASQDMPPTNA